jgi:predicted HTH transcriptional regulator
MTLTDLSKLTPSQFPTAEDESFEFKSSLMQSGEINKEVNHAASAFANSGGGCFIWGVDDKTGDPHGGVSPNVNRTELRTWIDRIVHNVSPPPKYDLEIYTNNEGRGRLDPGNVIAAVSIHGSNSGPHMAKDNRYYIRAGDIRIPQTIRSLKRCGHGDKYKHRC